MERNLRLVIIDYPKLLFDRPTVDRIFGDLLAARQRNYVRASAEYVSLSALDAISTHFIIYDQSDLYHPKVVAGVRLSYSNRAHHHRLRLSIEDHITKMPQGHQLRFAEFRKDRKVLVQVGALFTDPAYGYKKTGIRLFELVYFSGIHFLVRKGFDHYLGESNETFKVSKLVAKTGFIEHDLPFQHPETNSLHKLNLFYRLNYDWLQERLDEFGQYLDARVENTPDNYPVNETLLTVEEANVVIGSNRTVLKVAV